MKHDIHFYKAIFWDFDGVIKESTAAKTQAYVDLFTSYGVEVQSKVKQHHLQNGGISRFVKIPFYFDVFAGKKLSDEEIGVEAMRYRNMTLDAVVESAWVPGVMEYIQEHYLKQDFYVVTGTPQEDIDIICERLGINQYFKGVYGAPDAKASLVEKAIKERCYSKDELLFVGDALADYEAAQKNHIEFLLRQTDENRELFSKINVEKTSDFTELNFSNIK
jgi:phosphoglycolate phosphatase-like HAD superfamily hydrolase